MLQMSTDDRLTPTAQLSLVRELLLVPRAEKPCPLCGHHRPNGAPCLLCQDKPVRARNLVGAIRCLLDKEVER